MERFLYHFEPSSGWMNDPNGLCFYKGKYHLFFQHYPYDTKWGPMHWGHVITSDFIHFEELPVALTPDEEYENDGGCFSGSAVKKDGRLYLFYTSVSKKYGQAQSLAYSDDGIHFTKYEGNPVIRTVPEGATGDFRDPKVFKYENYYIMILGTKYNGHGRIVSYHSPDLIRWNYQGVLYECDDYSDAVECPDLFRINDKWILMYSMINSEIPCVFLSGDFDGKTFIKERKHIVEFGPHFYAPQTFHDEQGRRILIGWYYSWERKTKEGDYSAGAFTCPREVKMTGDKMLIYPLREIKPYLKETSLSAIDGIEIHVKQDLISVKTKDKSIEIKMNTESVEILEDVKGTEIFINKGETNISILK